jgi:threonine/homoserine/homoserine lactone efflux protein
VDGGDRDGPAAQGAGVGLALSGANPKNLALTAVAAASIAQAGLDPAGNVAAVAVYVLLGSLSVVGAVLYFLIAADRAVGPLNAVRGFMSANNAVIMMVIFLLLGAKLVGDGIAGIAN